MLRRNLLRLAAAVLLLASFAFAQSGVVYELRTYTAAPGKLEALKARFAGDTERIFKKHNMHTVGYWVPTDGDKASNTLIYILKFPSREAGEKAWADFLKDPEWIKVSTESEKNGKLVDKVERLWMSPTEFSGLK